ncbi:hypothetical protein, partial [Streptomyces sp. NPDC051554]|uniref:hypothetical protein n=1 Tax=Streptomyces sp. NPDC051554 TaxID=3365656 RepID=UPI0037B59A5D
MSRIRRLMASGLTASLLAVASGLALAAPSHAAVADMACEGQTTTNYSPGLTNTAQGVTISGTINFYACLSTSHPLLTKGKLSGGSGGPVTVSCAILEEKTSGTSTIVWANSSTTTFSYTTDVNVDESGLGAVTLSGKVTSGLFAGDNIVIAATYDSVQGTCASTGGITSRSGPTTLAIT